MKLFILITSIIGATILFYCNPDFKIPALTSNPNSSGDTSAASQNYRSGQQVSGVGTVSKILRDDLDGSRHQRFILTLTGGRTLLIAHNIDLAPRISSISIGDQIEFYGVFESNPKGGVIHWTHHDPNGRNIGGWLKKNGRIYQ